MITIPRVSSNLVDVAARVWPPIMQLRMRNPCIEKTLRILGITPPYSLRKCQRQENLHSAKEKRANPHENRHCTIPRVPSFGPKIALKKSAGIMFCHLSSGKDSQVCRHNARPAECQYWSGSKKKRFLTEYPR